MATTPPASTVIFTPATPRLGGETSRHHGTRQSTRTRRTRPTETPPPDTRPDNEPPVSTKRRKTSASHSNTIPQSPPSSAHTSPRSNTVKAKASNARNQSTGRHKRTMDNLIQSQDPTNDAQTKPNQAQAAGASALPTPVSIPRKKAVPRNLVESTARVLFPSRTDAVDESMPTPRKNRRSKKNVGFPLYSSMEDDGTSSEDRIQIFTDSKDKVPELDMSKDNPFIERPQEQSPQPEPVKSRSSRRKRSSPHIQSNPQIEEAFNRDQGMVYVFRGKKIYRKFPQDSDSEDEVGDPEDPAAEAPHRPLTRSSIKPRLLFPTAQQRAQRSAAAIAEEEAPTDIEDHTQKLVTPVKQSFGPATPPTTGHVTRSATKAQRDLTVSPLGPNEPASGPPPSWKGRSSPFGDWSRKKPGVQSSRLGKREGDQLERDDAKGPKKSKLHATD